MFSKLTIACSESLVSTYGIICYKFNNLLRQALIGWDPRYTKLYVPGDYGFYFEMFGNV